MSNATRPEVPARGAGPAPAGRIGTAVCATLLVAVHLVTAYLLLLAYAAEPAGPWDTETVSHSEFAAGTALGLTVVAALLTLPFVKARWLRRWWFAVPAMFALAAVLRLTLLAPQA
ncbi:hypothetical protein QFZ82_001921 [Streptomyces sp. V4I23]|uniref:hypothetical protein n=1 Tax=Streptomyces sp. V4I23 TaxID=3042282 RepID=UPI0027855EAB|nr:hypothetical protein [Streptomyces sp. V4I23]MDQ1007436.1 hypothetical protein [Streptomyces sp. V4I23]